MRPIPKRMITQTVGLHTFVSEQDTGIVYNPTTDNDPLSVRNVKIDAGIKRVVTQSGVEILGNAVMFVDKRITKPTMTSELLSSGSLIIAKEGTAEEHQYMIVAPNPFDDNDSLHHWEVMLE